MLAIAFLALSIAATPRIPAQYLVFQVSRTGEMTLYSRSVVTLDAEPASDPIPSGGVPGSIDADELSAEVPRDSERVIVDIADTGGRTRFRKNVDVDRFVRSEWADPLSGEMRTSLIELDDPAFVVRIPATAGQAVTVTHARSGRSTVIDLGATPVRIPVPEATLTPAPDSSNSANRLDILVMGDGYTSAQQSQFTSDASNLATAFFNLTPYSDYQNYANVLPLFTPSPQSGADHPPCSDPIKLNDPLEGTFVTTAFDASYCAGNLQRLLTVNFAKVFAAAAASPNWDKIFVLVNDTMYGGSGGPILVGSLNASSTNIIQHEFGHSFTKLADEYSSPNPGFPSCSDTFGSPCEANVTDQANRGSIKWSSWISPSTPIPTPDSNLTAVGLFTGARYLSSGMYRPQHGCLMNSLGAPFCAICRQAFILKLYQGWGGSPAAGIDMIEPGTESPSTTTPIPAIVGALTSFSFTLLQPAHGPAAVIQWSVDGTVVTGANGTSFQYAPSAAGVHAVSLTVTDTTTAVNPAMAGNSLKHTRSWTVNASGRIRRRPASGP